MADLTPVGSPRASDPEGSTPVLAHTRRGQWAMTPPEASGHTLPSFHQLDAEQRVIAQLPPGCGPRLLLGAPGTGRTTSVLALAVRRLQQGMPPDRLLILTPSRSSAARLRDALTAAVSATMSSPPVRAWQAYAFDLLRRAHGQGLLPGVGNPPKLLSGPEQDVLIRELMEGHAQGIGAAVVWPENLREAVATRGFRQEMRELFDRMSEHDLTPEDLEGLAVSLDRPQWRTAAAFRREYLAVRRLRMPEAFDPAALVTEAARVLEDNQEFLMQEQRRLELVVVDDLQEATPSIHRLLSVLCAGRDVVMTASPDTVVQGFRGARPDALRDLPRRMEANGHTVQIHVLEQGHRMGQEVQAAWQRVAGKIPSVTARRIRSVTAADPAADPVVGSEGAPARSFRSVVTAGGIHEARWIGHAVLDRHLLGGVPLQDMAVIVRNSARLSFLQRHLEALGIPVSTSAAESPVREEPAVRPLLAALRLVVAAERLVADDSAPAPLPGAPFDVGPATEAPAPLEGDEGDAEVGDEAATERPAILEAAEAVELLSSRIGGASAMEIRRLRQRLRYAEIRDGGGRASDRLLVEALLVPGALEAAGVRSTPARRIARMLQAGRTALKDRNATAETVLWALWEAAGVAATWRRDALNGGETGRRADRDLDAVVGLFEMAERFVDHLPGAGPAEFLDFLELQELPMDTLAARAPTRATLEIMTPATAAGRQWPVVFVAGVQEGQWPNTALRGQLLGADLLTDAVELGVEVAAHTSPVTRLNQVRHDELRSFSTAVSRASRELVVTAVADQDEEPSEFLELVDPWDVRTHPEAATTVRPTEKAPRPLTLRALTAQLRESVQAADPAGEEALRAEAAARMLHRLSRARSTVAGADPDQWWGLLPLSSTGPVLDTEQPVPVSPSRIETIHRSPMDWFVSTARAEEATDPARSLGTLVHSIAEDAPEAPSSELLDLLERRWPELGLPETWETDLVKERARGMLRKYAQYVIDARKDQGRQLAAVEGSFTVLVKGQARDALLRGRVDRLEVDSHGRYVVVDLKTGTKQPAGADLPLHPQLGSYQVALAAGAGAAIVNAAHGTRADAEDTEAVAATEHAADRANPTDTDVLLRVDDAGPSAEPGGAILVQLGTQNKNYSAQTQEPLAPEDDWARDLVTAAADLVAGERFLARHSAQNSGQSGFRCRLPGICPLCSQGRQVTE